MSSSVQTDVNLPLSEFNGPKTSHIKLSQVETEQLVEDFVARR